MEISSRYPPRVLPKLLPIFLLGSTLVFLAGCSATDPQNTLSPAGDVARRIGDLYWQIFWWGVGVFVVVEGLLLFSVLRFRRKPGQDMPYQTHGNTRLEIAWTIAPALILVTIAVPTVRTIADLYQNPSSEALQVRVIAHQWWWEFGYPDLGIVTANEMHIPVGRIVKVSVESGDVIHSFWVPKLAGKKDAFPNKVNEMWFNASEPGEYFGQCAELCGASHALMRFRVIAQLEDEFEGWVKAQKTPPGPPVGEGAKGAELFARSACIGCHTIQGTPAVGKAGPDLTHFGSRTTLAAGIMENTPENLAKWLRNPPAIKQGSLMPNLNLTEDQISALVAYLTSLK